MTKAEEYIKFYTKNCSNEMLFKNKDGSKLYHPWLTPDDAKSAVEIAKEEVLLNVAEWIEDTFIFSKDAKKDFSQTFNINLL